MYFCTICFFVINLAVSCIHEWS